MAQTEWKLNYKLDQLDFQRSMDVQSILRELLINCSAHFDFL